MKEDGMVAQVHTIHTLKTTRQFLRFQYRVPRRIWTVILVFTVVILLLLMTLPSQPYRPSLPELIMLPMVTVLLYLQFNGLFYTKKRHVKEEKLVPNGQTITFYRDGFLVDIAGETVTSQSHLDYSALLKAAETKDAFYLYLSKQRAYLVSKSGFQSGTPEDLRTLLQHHLPSRKVEEYKGRKNKTQQ